MAWNDLKAAVAAVIKTNGTQAITGALLQSTLNSIIDQVGANATFKGIATPATSPGTPDGPQFYLTGTKGVYANFGGVTVTSIGIYVLSNASGSWALVPVLSDIFNKQTTSDKVIRFFSRNDKTIDPFIDFNGTVGYDTTPVEVYSAFKELKLFGFDKTAPHKLAYFWINRQGEANPQYRFIIHKWTGSAWTSVFDYNTLTPTLKGNCWYLHAATGNLIVRAVVDLKDLPAQVDGTIEPSTTSSSYIIDEACFDTSDYSPLKLAKDKILTDFLTSDVVMQSVESKTLTTKNEVLFPCFVRNQADVSTSLDAVYMSGYKRKLKYQAFKGLKLYGFDTTKKYMISHFWVDSYDASHLYRIIIKQWDGDSWESYFDTGTISKTDLGVQDGKIFTWNKTIGTFRMVAQIDFSNLATNDSTTLNSGEPDLIINPSCIYDQDLSKTSNVEFNTLKLNGTIVVPLTILNSSARKTYFNSRRKPTFAFIWDDLNPTDALVYSVFREYGFLPSFALISNNLNAGNASEYQNYYMNGCTILAHSISHPAMSDPGTITYAEVDNQMKTSKKLIEAYGMKVSGWVTPSSSLHPDFFPLMVKNFGYGFTSLNGGIFNSTVDPLKMGRFGLEPAMANHDHTTVINRIDSAITNNELLVFYSHRLPSIYLNADTTPYVTVDDLRFVLDYLKTKADDNLCQVLPCDEAVQLYYKTPLY